MIESPEDMLDNRSSEPDMQLLSWGSYRSWHNNEVVSLTGVRYVDPK